ncbi:MAG TPA: TlpA disulfide reductase family protein [Gemmatimonadaceae bacterium]|nr:TlpA disulfide reductase family protein [Gemmatimonadaceae bacterium]
MPVSQTKPRADDKRPRRWPRPWTIVFAAVWVFVLVRLAPHLGAIVGIRSGNDIAPFYSATTLDGKVVTSDSLRGRVVLVNFWATWCLPCRAEMPFLESMWKRHRDEGLVILGLSVDRGGEAEVRQWVEARTITYPIARVGGSAEAAFGGVQGIPTSFLLDRDGRIRHRVVGPLAPVSLEPAVRRLLSQRE